MKRNAILLSLLTALFLLPGKAVGQTTSSDGKLVYNFPFAPSEGLVNRTEKEYRKEVCLNGYWDFQPVALPGSYVQGKGIAPELPLPKEGGLEQNPHKNTFSPGILILLPTEMWKVPIIAITRLIRKNGSK